MVAALARCRCWIELGASAAASNAARVLGYAGLLRLAAAILATAERSSIKRSVPSCVLLGPATAGGRHVASLLPLCPHEPCSRRRSRSRSAESYGLDDLEGMRTLPMVRQGMNFRLGHGWARRMQHQANFLNVDPGVGVDRQGHVDRLGEMRLELRQVFETGAELTM